MALTNLHEAIKESLHQAGVPGAVIGISRRGDHEALATGFASLDSGLPVLNETLFRIASITKPMTATMIMALVAQRLIDLERPVHEYLPNVTLGDGPSEWRTSITMRHLLSHTSGFDCELLEDLGKLGNGSQSLATAISHFDRLHQWAAPGTTMSYGNTGYWLAGRIAETVTGDTFEQSMRKKVFAPLQLENTLFSAEQAIVHPVALGHTPTGAHSSEHQLLRSFAYPRARRASGGVISLVGDLLRFADWHLGLSVDGPVIPIELRDAMQSPVTRLRSSDQESWGLGWNIRTAKSGTKIIGHGGSFGGYQTQLSLVPEHAFAFVILTNSSQGSKAIKPIERTVLDHMIGVSLHDPVRATVPGIDMTQFAGLWSQPLDRYHVESRDDALYIDIETPNLHDETSHRSGPIRFDNIGGSDFVCFEGPHQGTRADFIRDPESGRYDFLRVGLRVARRI